MARDFPFTIRQVAGILKLKIRYDNPDNGNMDTDCPFCYKQSKLNLNAAKNVFRCNYCNAKGGMVEMYAKVYDVSNSQAYQEICEITERNKETATVYNTAKATGCEKATESEQAKPSVVLATPKPLPAVAPDFFPVHVNTSSEPQGDISQTPRASGETIHQTYSMMLTMLALANPHKELLMSKGLTAAQIETHRYKSVPAFGQQGLCERLIESGCTLEGVPGFYRADGVWNVKLKAPGIIIPVCGIDGKIAGVQIRLNKPVNERKYIWLSTPDSDGGASSGSPLHFVGDLGCIGEQAAESSPPTNLVSTGEQTEESLPPTSSTAKRVYITDGALKGTVAHALSGYTFICLPGVKGLNGLDGLIPHLKANGVVEIFEAFNINKLNDNQTGASAKALRDKLTAQGFTVISAVWGDNSFNGIDDYFLHRKQAKINHVYDVDITAAESVA